VSDGRDWAPTASLATLRLRAEILGRIRAFFVARGVLEVETPVLGAATASDPHLASLATRCALAGVPGGALLYLQTSPEAAMKRLLAAGSGPIYQLARAFRDGEAGRWHNPEFTLLEWYRPGFDHHALMDEVDDLLGSVLGWARSVRLSYAAVFAEHAGVPATADDAVIEGRARALGLCASGLTRSIALDFLFSHAVQPRLQRDRPVFVYDFPPIQAALARIRPGPPAWAERFELFMGGVELANGYHELTDPGEQRERLERDLAARRRMGLHLPPIDERLLGALASGLPPCAGVALGIDRLVMAAAGAECLAEVIGFPVHIA
jgi:lysyl-tRNA synthetase class 2